MFCINLIQFLIFAFCFKSKLDFTFYKINSQFTSKNILLKIKPNNKANMKKSSLIQAKKRHKSQFYSVNQSQIRKLKPKRLSCMGAEQLKVIEESLQVENVSLIIESLLQKVFQQIDQAQKISSICLHQIQNKVELLQEFNIYNMQLFCENDIPQVIMQAQPKTQQKHRVIVSKQKQDTSLISFQKDTLIIPQLNTNISSNSNAKSNKFLTKQKLSKLTSIYGVGASSKSIKSIISNRGNSHGFNPFKLSGRIEEQKESSKSRQKRQKEEIIKRLMRQYQTKLKETSHCCPQPIQQNYRSFFTQPQSKQEQDLRSSFMHLRQVKQSQQMFNRQKKVKRITKFMNAPDLQMNKQNKTRTTKLPTIYKTVANIKNSLKKQGGVFLYTQDYNGEIISVKNQPRVDTQTRQYSLTTHQNFNKKPQQTALKQISHTNKINYEYLKNEKIKDQSLYLNDNSSILSTYCNTMDEQMMTKSIMDNFKQKNGVKIKKLHYQHRSSMSVVIEPNFKLPSINMKG